MKAVIIKGAGGPETVEVGDRPLPEPRGDQIRVRVRATGLNRADLLQTQGSTRRPRGCRRTSPVWSTRARSMRSGRT